MDLKIFDNGDEAGEMRFEIWLDPDAALFEGLCVGYGRSEAEAYFNACNNIGPVLVSLQEGKATLTEA